MQTYVPHRIQRWTRPDSYFGAEWPDYFSSGVGRSRNSDALERSNFECMLRDLGGESETVVVVRESHWAVGWVEWIAIHESDAKALEIADDTRAAMDDYPVVDEDHFSQTEWDECADFWDGLSPREKVQMAIHERSRYHWLQSEPVWYFGRRRWGDLPDTTIGRAIEETVRGA